MSLFNEISKYETDMENSVVSFMYSSLGKIESIYDDIYESHSYLWIIRRQYV